MFIIQHASRCIAGWMHLLNDRWKFFVLSSTINRVKVELCASCQFFLKNINRNIDLYFLVQWNDFKAQVEVYTHGHARCMLANQIVRRYSDRFYNSGWNILNACWPKNNSHDFSLYHVTKILNRNWLKFRWRNTDYTDYM